MSVSTPSAPGGMFSLFKHRPRIVVCALVGVAIYFLLPASMRVATRGLVAWNGATLLFFGLVGGLVARSTRQSISAHAALEDENQWVLLLGGIIAAGAAMAAIVAELGVVKEMVGAQKGTHIALTAATIFSAWAFIHLLFALHYAHEYYAPTPDPDDPVDAVDARWAHLAPDDIRIDLSRAIHSLPEHYREVILLRDIEEFSIDEIASVLSLTRESVKARIHRARFMIREYLIRD